MRASRPASITSFQEASLLQAALLKTSWYRESMKAASSSQLNKKIEASINFICSELQLDPIVKATCAELARYLEQISGGDKARDMPDSVANAVACSLVSLAHEELWRKKRVARHLPDRIIGQSYGLSSSAVVYNKCLINSEITKKRIAEFKGMRQPPKTLR